MILHDKRMYTGIIHDLTDVKAAEARVLELNRQLENKVAERTEELARAIDRLLGINRKLEREINDRQSVEHALRVREQELQQALDKEKELNALKSRFVSMASHEFRTPLSTILSSVELVEMYQREDQQDRRTRHIERIKTAVSNLTDILNDFLSLSRLEEGRIESQPEPFLLEDFITSTIDEVEHLFKTGQRLHYQGDYTQCTVVLDKRFLKNILFNLLSNASKYSDEGQIIRCFAQITGNELTLEVKDEGIGIPEEDQKHLCTRFFRANNVENIKGTGLGLHIVRRYVELMQGKMSFSSQLGKGSTFSVTVPIIIQI
jgi:signal transduction histidine kinase